MKILNKKTKTIEGFPINWYTNVDFCFNGSVFLFVHGAGEEPSCWDQIIQALPKREAVIVFERPGYGDSEIGPLSSIKENVILLDQVIDQYKSAKIIVVGHSLGGYMALNLSSCNIYGRVLIGSFAHFRTNRIDISSEKLLQNIRNGFSISTPSVIIDSFIKNNVASEKCFENDYKMTHSLEYPPNIQKLPCDTLVIHGVDDNVVSERQTKRLVKYIIYAKVVNIPKSGHNVIVEKPSKISELICKYVKEVEQ